MNYKLTCSCRYIADRKLVEMHDVGWYPFYCTIEGERPEQVIVQECVCQYMV